MNDDHAISRAIGLDKLDSALVNALQQAWCKGACWPGCIEGYPKNRDDNPSFGNCFVSSLAVWAANGMKDELIPGKVGEAWHFRLGLYGKEKSRLLTVVDPTWQQFAPGDVFRALNLTPAGAAEYKEVMFESLWRDESLVPRLDILLERMAASGYKVGASAVRIVEMAQAKYAFVPRLGVQPAPRPAAPAA